MKIFVLFISLFFKQNLAEVNLFDTVEYFRSVDSTIVKIALDPSSAPKEGLFKLIMAYNGAFLHIFNNIRKNHEKEITLAKSLLRQGGPLMFHAFKNTTHLKNAYNWNEQEQNTIRELLCDAKGIWQALQSMFVPVNPQQQATAQQQPQQATQQPQQAAQQPQQGTGAEANQQQRRGATAQDIHVTAFGFGLVC